MISANRAFDFESDTSAAASIPDVSADSSSTATEEIGTQVTGTLQPIITLGSQTMIAEPTVFVVTRSSGASPINASPGRIPISVGNDVASLGSSEALVVDSSTIILGSLPDSLPASVDAPSVLQAGPIAIASVIGGSTVIETFLPTTISSLADLSTPQTTSTALAIGSSTSVVPMVIVPGGVACNILSQTPSAAILLPPTGFPAPQTNVYASSTASEAFLLPALAQRYRFTGLN